MKRLQKLRERNKSLLYSMINRFELNHSRKSSSNSTIFISEVFSRLIRCPKHIIEIYLFIVIVHKIQMSLPSYSLYIDFFINLSLSNNIERIKQFVSLSRTKVIREQITIEFEEC